MHHGQNQKIVVLTQPAAIVNNASLTIAELDSVQNGNKFDYVTFFFVLGATDIALTALKLQESDVSGSGFADVTGSLFGGTGNPALPSATDDNKVYAIRVALNGGRKRYFKPVVTIGNGATGAYMTVFALLERGKEAPSTATKRGVAGEILIPAP